MQLINLMDMFIPLILKKINNTPCLRCFMPLMPTNDMNDCERDGVIGTLAGIVVSIKANEVVK